MYDIIFVQSQNTIERFTSESQFETEYLTWRVSSNSAINTDLKDLNFELGMSSSG